MIHCLYWCTYNHRLTCGWQGGAYAPPVFLFGYLVGREYKKLGEWGGERGVCVY